MKQFTIMCKAKDLMTSNVELCAAIYAVSYLVLTVWVIAKCRSKLKPPKKGKSIKSMRDV